MRECWDNQRTNFLFYGITYILFPLLSKALQKEMFLAFSNFVVLIRKASFFACDRETFSFFLLLLLRTKKGKRSQIHDKHLFSRLCRSQFSADHIEQTHLSVCFRDESKKFRARSIYLLFSDGKAHKSFFNG